MDIVFIRRQFNDHRVAQAPLDKLNGIHWDNTSGGVYSIAPQLFIHAYVLCTDVKGDLAHSCQHGPPPHSIKVVVLKKDNSPEVFNKLIEIAGPKPKTHHAKPYNPNSDIKDIYNALISGNDHIVIEYKNNKKLGNIIVIKPKKIKKLSETGTENTIRARANKVSSGVESLMKENDNLIQISYGSWLSYKKKNQPKN